MSARYFSEIVRKIPGNIISIETDEKYICTIKSGETKFSIIGMPPEEYPDLLPPLMPERVLRLRETSFAV